MCGKCRVMVDGANCHVMWSVGLVPLSALMWGTDLGIASKVSYTHNVFFILQPMTTHVMCIVRFFLRRWNSKNPAMCMVSVVSWLMLQFVM